MIETIQFRDKTYPKLQSTGFAAKFCFPFAKELLSGNGLDIGCNCKEWSFPGAVPIDPELDSRYHAMKLPDGEYDYILSSHMLEHYVGRFQDAIEYWLTKVKESGIVFLYLPNCDYQKYWAWGNKKHMHYLNPKIMKEFCETLNVKKHIVTDGYDLNGSFYCIIEK